MRMRSSRRVVESPSCRVHCSTQSSSCVCALQVTASYRDPNNLIPLHACHEAMIQRCSATAKEPGLDYDAPAAGQEEAKPGRSSASGTLKEKVDCMRRHMAGLSREQD